MTQPLLNRVFVSTLISILRFLIFTYLIFRYIYIFTLHLTPLEYVFGFAYLFAETFILVQSLGYLRYLKTVICIPHELPERIMRDSNLTEYPPVAVVVASYKEPLDILEETLICFRNLTYPNKHLFLLDDTRYDGKWDTEENKQKYKSDLDKLCKEIGINVFRRKWHDAKAGLINDFLLLMQGDKNPEFHVTLNDPDVKVGTEKYIAIFDADMNPFPYFLENLIDKMEEDQAIAFVQTPQYYTNFQSNRVARAASLMQVIFYEYICEAKGMQGVNIFCGTNGVMRVQSLTEIGGLDFHSVTEDFATGYKLHTRGYKSLYINKVSAFGLGPQDLGALFKQQHRWALGTVGMVPMLLLDFIKNPFRKNFNIWIEYFLSSSYYLIGWVYFILMLGPIAYLFFGFPVYLFPVSIYCLLLIPYNIIMNFLFYWTLCNRSYGLKDLFLGVVMSFVTIPIYMAASLKALLGFKGQFVVTPKKDEHSLPFYALWPQITLALIAYITALWGILRMIFEGSPLFGLAINVFWSLYFFSFFVFIFYFNDPKEIEIEPKQV